jgi:hypothetical protein
MEMMILFFGVRARAEWFANALRGTTIGAGLAKIAGGEAAHDRKEK